jgi:peptide/nickel transport system permease protein
MSERAAPAAAVVLLAALLVGLWVAAGGADPNRTDAARRLEAPSAEHPFGTDELGRSVAARVLAAARLDLSIAVAATAAAFIVGVVIGALSAYGGGAVDSVLMRALEILQSIPGILLGLLLVVLLPGAPGFITLVLAIAAMNIPVYARLTRAELAPRVASPVTGAARLAGVSHARVLLVYLLPQGLTSAVAYVPVQAGFSVSVAAGFGFIGVGIRPPQAEWGLMIRQGLSGMLYLDAWWPVLVPAAAIAATVLGLYALGRGLSAKVGT